MSVNVNMGESLKSRIISLFCTFLLCLSYAGLTSQACMSLHLVSTMDTFYYSLLLFNLCTALGETSALACA